MEQRAGFEPAALRICSPLHWASLPPLRCEMVPGFHRPLIKPLWVINLPPLYIQWTFYMVGVAGFEPAASCSQSRPSDRTDLHPEFDFLLLALQHRLCIWGCILRITHGRIECFPAVRCEYFHRLPISMYDIVDRCDTNRDNHQTQHHQNAADQKVRSLFYIHASVLENGAG